MGRQRTIEKDTERQTGGDRLEISNSVGKRRRWKYKC